MELTVTAQLRRMVLEHISRYTWNDALIDHVYDILKEVQEDSSRYRCCVYKERAVLKNRIDMVLGQDCDENIIEAAKKTLFNPERRDLPVIDVLPAACDQCPIEKYYVTDMCRHCITHKCMDNCPKKAITRIQDRAFINRELCVECGRCKQSCPYGAIIEINRPCVRACAVNAISMGENRKAVIDHEKCVSCGACRNACPFGAIDERSNIVRVIKALKSSRKVIALVAPSVIGQYGFKIKPGQVYAALKKVGFNEIIEVGVGADITAKKEAIEYVEKVPAELNFMTSSCCPAFVKLVKRHLPDLAHHVSETPSPMVSAGILVKSKFPNATTVFIGPCIAKKAEAYEHSDVIDYVLTFEELMCMCEGKDIYVEELDDTEYQRDASKLGLGFALTAGVSAAVVDTVQAVGGSVRKGHYAAGVDTILRDLKAVGDGKIDCSYFEGRACPNGCIDGPGTVGDFRLTNVALTNYAKSAPNQVVLEDQHTKD